jgi:serine/threonine protein kinase
MLPVARYLARTSVEVEEPAGSGPRNVDQEGEEVTVALGPADVHLLSNEEGDVSWVSEPPALPAGMGRRFGRYELLGRFAQGGMAEIYLARQANEADLQRYLVVKCIQPATAKSEQFQRLFLREARVALRLKHPNICHIYEFGQQEGRYYLAMEWVEGASMLELLRRAFEDGQFVSTPVVLKIVADVAEALDYAHRVRDHRGRKLGVVHRDVSPQNVAVGWDGTVKLLDFGVAKVQTDGYQTHAGMVAGKFGYMAPEQCREERLDGRCDVFALGILLYEALAGRRLYHRRNDYDTMKAILEEPPPRLRERRPSLPEELERIVMRALAKDPADRYASAGHMALTLQQYLADRGELVSRGRVADVMRCYFAVDIHRGIPLLDTDTELMRSLPSMGAQPPPIDEAAPFGGEHSRWRRPRRRWFRRRSASGGTHSLSSRATRFVLRRPRASLGIVGGLLALLIGAAFFMGWALHAPALNPRGGALPMHGGQGGHVAEPVLPPAHSDG